MDEEAAWRFYQNNARPFVAAYGLMPAAIAELRLRGESRRIFLERLCLIHETHLEVQAEALRRARDKE